MTIVRGGAWAAVAALVVALVWVVTWQWILLIPLAAITIFVMVVALYGPERVGSWFMILAVFFAPMMSVRPLYPAIIFVTASDLCVVLAVGLLAPRLLSRRLTVPPHFILGWVLIISGGLLGSLVASPDPVTSINYMIRFIIAGLMLPIVFLLWAPTVTQVRQGAAGYLMGQAVSTAVGLLQGPRGNERYFGLTTHALFFGPAGVLATGCGLYLLGRVEKRSHQVAVLAGLGIAFASVVMSGSRACLLTAVLVYIIYAVTHRSYVTLWWMALGGLTIGVTIQQIIALSGPGSAIHRLAGDSTTEYADTRRTEELFNALRQIAEHPFTGDGYLTVVSVHNVPLEMLVAGGVLGFVGFLFMIYPMLKDSFEISREGGLSLIPIAWLITAMTVPRLWDRIIWIGLALALAGLTLHTTRGAPGPGSEPGPEDRFTAPGRPARAR